MRQLKAVLLDGPAKMHSDANRRYLLSLDTERIFSNFLIQAGLNSNRHILPRPYGGWEDPASQVHGCIAGHYLSACSLYAYYADDMELRGRVVKAVDILELCQSEGEGGWVGSIPPVYLERIARGKWVWAPHYNLHKTIMGLIDAYRYAGVEKALSILERLAGWFLEWSGRFTYEEMQDILDNETGGMMEAWADLYGFTGKEEHRELMERYAHYRFFDRLLDGTDILTNTHANTTIPEAHGFARAFQVTGEEKYRDYAQRYLDLAMARDQYSTGGQTSGECWLDHILHADLGDQNQEHCTVYNMIRLCEYALSWNPDVKYADYIERNILNGLMAQHRLSDGMNTYYLPLGTGRRKDWSTPHDHMTCCLGTTMQANASYEARVFYEQPDGVVVAQYIPSSLTWQAEGRPVHMRLTSSAAGNDIRRPEKALYRLAISCAEKTAFRLTVRVPSWSRETVILVNGTEVCSCPADTCRWVDLPGEWQDDTVEILCTQALTVSRLGETDYYSVLYGPAVLAGLTDDDRSLPGIGSGNITELVKPRSVRDWNVCRSTWETEGPRSVVLKPLHEIDEEIYTVYFKK